MGPLLVQVFTVVNYFKSENLIIRLFVEGHLVEPLLGAQTTLLLSLFIG